MSQSEQNAAKSTPKKQAGKPEDSFVTGDPQVGTKDSFVTSEPGKPEDSFVTGKPKVGTKDSFVTGNPEVGTLKDSFVTGEPAKSKDS